MDDATVNEPKKFYHSDLPIHERNVGVRDMIGQLLEEMDTFHDNPHMMTCLLMDVLEFVGLTSNHHKQCQEALDKFANNVDY